MPIKKTHIIDSWFETINSRRKEIIESTEFAQPANMQPVLLAHGAPSML